MSAGYEIQVGNESPAEAIIATPNKKTGEPVGPQMKTFIRVGNHLLINRARIWGRRVIGGKPKGDGSDIEFNTVGYKGEIEFLEWGTQGGYAIDIRYLPQSRSLDFEYQQNVQKIVINPEQEGVHIILKAGKNKFDTSKDDVKVQFLKVYPQNRDSKSKNPDPAIKGWGYYEVTDEHVDVRSIEAIETSMEASGFVKNLSGTPQKIRNLFTILGQREEFGSTDKLSGDLEIYKTLLQYANQNAKDFFYLISEYKRQVRDDFEKAKSFNALDLTKDGHIALEVNNKKHLILSDIKAKGEDMVEWVIANFYEEEVFKATQIFKESVSKLK